MSWGAVKLCYGGDGFLYLVKGLCVCNVHLFRGVRGLWLLWEAGQWAEGGCSGVYLLYLLHFGP